MASKMKDILENIEKRSIADFSEKAYLEYSMYVIMDRALPHIGDGLKPVQRRIIYAMSELGLDNAAKYKKSARTIGDVLGKFHPHGDSACYEAMVLLAQPFSYRYPLVDGQGNWGSPDDPKSFAAMRYTEAKLTKFSDLLLSELGQKTVEWSANFDATLMEPKVLPARLPVLLLNGTTGIAVGMATDVPPHNLRELVQGCIALLNNPNLNLQELMEIIPGPDLPTSAEIITPKESIEKIYETGHGSFRMRALYVIEQDDIVITALPYQVSGSKILEQIANQMRAKKLPMVADLRDESDHENPTRLVIMPRNAKIDKQALMSHLFATTDLEQSYRVNMNVIGLDGRPQVKPLIPFLKEWLEFRMQTVIKRLEYGLAKTKTRMHLLEGLLIAYLNIEEIIHIIRTEDNPKEIFITKFKLSELQAESILELKLRHIAKLEEIKIQSEQAALEKERDRLEKILSSETRLKSLIKKELEEDQKKYGDPRRSPLIIRADAKVMDLMDYSPPELISVVLSEKGWIRSAKGHEVQGDTLSYKAGDECKIQVLGKSNDQLLFLDSTGRSYTVFAHRLPSARGFGEPLSSMVSAPSGARFISMKIFNEADLPKKMLLISTNGYGFISTLEDLVTKNKKGKNVIKCGVGNEPLAIEWIHPEQKQLALLSDSDKLLVVPLSELPELTQGKGNKLINLSSDAKIIAIGLLRKQDQITIRSQKKQITLTAKDLAAYVGKRADSPKKVPTMVNVLGLEIISKS